MSIIQVKHITKIFGAHPQKMLPHAKRGVDKAEMQNNYHHALGLYDINLDIEPGEVFVIMGLSGSGKSTLIRHFNRLIEPTDGQIFIHGEDVTAMSQRQLRQFRRQTMSMVFQHFGLMPHKTVLDNVAYAQLIRGVAKDEAYQSAEKWLDLVGLSGYGASYPRQLSGGQQQRVGLARALVADTDIILMDEAFSALDPLIRSQMQEQLMALQQQLHKTIVFITHDLSEALRIGSRIAILKEGQVAQLGTPQDILLNPADDYVKDFVKDVNRASVLNVQALMTEPKLFFDGQSLSEAHNAMMAQIQPWAWVKTGNRYEGLLTLNNLEKAMKNSPNASLTDIVEKPQSVLACDTIEELIPAAIGNEYPIPVLDEAGSLSGVVVPDAVVDVIVDSTNQS